MTKCTLCEFESEDPADFADSNPAVCWKCANAGDVVDESTEEEEVDAEDGPVTAQA